MLDKPTMDRCLCIPDGDSIYTCGFLEEIIKNNWSSPIMIPKKSGDGKVTAIQDLAKKLNLQYVELRPSLEDKYGLNSTSDIANAIEEYLISLGLEKDSSGLLILDEFLGFNDGLIVASEFLRTKIVGNYKLPDNWTIGFMNYN